MLKCLRIQNFAIIDSVSIDFEGGLNIISGETGAGKSIIMDALLLILGGRASGDLIRAGASEASVEALFDIENSSEIFEALDAAGIPADADELIVRRVVQANGKNRVFINGTMASISTLSGITSRLVDLCGQHDQQLLTKGEEQLLWIDRFGGLEELRISVKKSFQSWKTQKDYLESLSTDAQERTRRIDFLNFQIQELEEAGLSSSAEDAAIEQELKILSSGETLYAFAQEAEQAIDGSESEGIQSVAVSLGSLLNKARSLSAVDPKLNAAIEFLNTLKVNIDELSIFIRTYAQGVSRDENRLEELNARSAFLTKLKRKYGPSLSDVLNSFEQFKKELVTLENHASSLHSAEEDEKKAFEVLERFAKELSQKRTKAAKKFSTAVEKELSDLNMERAKFEVSIAALEIPNASGIDVARFLISPNPGEALNSLQKIASGGELSRVMLAIQNVISSHGGVGVYLFDEIDAGIGGKTAVAVGAKIQKVSSNTQVICITHLPQVACFADAHFRVEKSVQKKGKEERTVCSVIALKQDDQVEELSRMLGGLDNDKAALANAKAMLANAKKLVKKPAGKDAATGASLHV